VEMIRAIRAELRIYSGRGGIGGSALNVPPVHGHSVTPAQALPGESLEQNCIKSIWTGGSTVSISFQE
jgi:hypothetical protein